MCPFLRMALPRGRTNHEMEETIMKKLLAIVLALALCLGMVTMATAETTKYKIGVLVPLSLIHI